MLKSHYVGTGRSLDQAIEAALINLSEGVVAAAEHSRQGISQFIDIAVFLVQARRMRASLRASPEHEYAVVLHLDCGGSPVEPNDFYLGLPRDIQRDRVRNAIKRTQKALRRARCVYTKYL